MYVINLLYLLQSQKKERHKNRSFFDVFRINYGN